MPFRRAAIIYNPMAGGYKQTVNRVGQAADALRRFIPDVELFPTEHNRRADALARQAVEQGFDLVAPCGGDGTINEALQGVATSGAALFPLPAGTANVLAWETGIPVDPVKAALAAPDYDVVETPLGVVEFPHDGVRRLFLLMCGAGVDAGAVYRLNVDLKNRVGIAAYFWSAFQQLFKRFERLQIRVHGEALDCTLTVVSKTRLYGGKLVLTPNAHLLAPEFDVVCFRSGSPLLYTGYFAGVVTRTLDLFKGVQRRHSAEVELLRSDSPNVYVQVDGELAGRLPAIVRMGPETVNMLLPRAYVERRPSR